MEMRVGEAIPANEAPRRVPCCKGLDVVVVEGVDDSMFLVILSVVLRFTVLAALLMLGCYSLLAP